MSQTAGDTVVGKSIVIVLASAVALFGCDESNSTTDAESSFPVQADEFEAWDVPAMSDDDIAAVLNEVPEAATVTETPAELLAEAQLWLGKTQASDHARFKLHEMARKLRAIDELSGLPSDVAGQIDAAEEALQEDVFETYHRLRDALEQRNVEVAKQLADALLVKYSDRESDIFQHVMQIRTLMRN